MPPRRNLTPSYLLHKQSGRGRLVWTDRTGNRQQKLLPGPFGSPESLAAKARLELELATSPTAAPTATSAGGMTVAEVLIAYLTHAERYYRRPDGRPGSELVSIKRSIRPVRELYADRPAAAFGPKALAAVRQSMIDAGLCRGLINSRVDRVKRAFRWAASEELVPVTTYEALRTLAGLRRGHTDARESEPVVPVADEVVRATLPRLPAYVRVMVELLWYTGMRPSEVVSMTLGQIDRSGEPWVYSPAHHKTAHRGKPRTVPLGPNARAVLATFLADRALGLDERLFNPRRAREERYERLRKVRKSKVQPSQASRRKATPRPATGRARDGHARRNPPRAPGCASKTRGRRPTTPRPGPGATFGSTGGTLPRGVSRSGTAHGRGPNARRTGGSSAGCAVRATARYWSPGAARRRRATGCPPTSSRWAERRSTARAGGGW